MARQIAENIQAGQAKTARGREKRTESTQPSADQAAARAFFPRGLLQPEGSFRFSLDALLLASFLEPGKCGKVLDIGTGCGVVALGMLCRYPGIRVVGIDRETLLAEAAIHNAAQMGFSNSFDAICIDAGNQGLFAKKQQFPSKTPEIAERAVEIVSNPFPEGGRFTPLASGSFDLALANPPYREPGRGRLPHGRLRRSALFEEDGSLDAFCSCAFLALKDQGRFGLIYPSARITKLLQALERNGLAPMTALPVHTKTEAPPKLTLLASVKCVPTSSVTFESLPPLVLYQDGENGRLTEQALAFCPFLNAAGAK